MATELSVRETLPQLIRRALAPPDRSVFLERAGGAWTSVDCDGLLKRIENLACAIRALGMRGGDRVALIAHDCVDWIVADFATLFAGCVVVPIYPTQALDHTTYILEHSGARLIFTDSRARLDALRTGAAPALPAIVFEDSAADGLAAAEARGAALRAADATLPAAYEASLSPEDLAVLIYTSGTTGRPKGVMLSHDNISFDARASLSYGLDELSAGNVVLSVLPFSHIFEHTILYVYLLAGVKCYVCRDPSALLADMQDARPTAMTAVPRIFDRVLAGVKGAAMKAGGVQGRLVPWALECGREYAAAITFGGGPSPAQRLRYALANAVVLRKVRRRLGLDRMEFFVSGSAALHVDTAMTFLGIGVPIMQGYGLTESSPVISASRSNSNEFGASGRSIPGVEVKIAPDGEIVTRGRHVMLGYYRDPEATASAIVDGWLHTGDVGEIDAKAFLRITDRKREVFKTDTGKWVAPARVEAAIKRSVFVAAAMVVGDGRPYPVALVCPNWELLRLELSLPAGASADELAPRADVREFFEGVARDRTRDLGSFEQIRRVVVLPHEFSVESGELSPSMKIKRRVVEQRYAPQIDAAYAAAQPGGYE